MKLKIGDKVKVFRTIKDKEKNEFYSEYNFGVFTISKYIGELGEIVDIDSITNYFYAYVIYDDALENRWFPLFILNNCRKDKLKRLING